MHILGISSATKVISIGLIDDDQVLVDQTVDDIHAEKILAYIQEAGIKPEQIEGIAAAIGPGSYSGLRGGAAAAKTLAQVLNVPLVGVSTLAAIAYNLIDSKGTIAVILDAKREDVNFALFEVSNRRIKRLIEDTVIKNSEISVEMAKIKGSVHLAKGAELHPYGINVAKLGLLKIKAQKCADPLKLKPRYSHMPNIREYVDK
ncbi:tRNA (adenosine(37)-N6)-threonylcarbamoyltransferase complex dimerization subunit type 1 TsaB [Candidatus Margulisiibacteriota bacterium]